MMLVYYSGSTPALLLHLRTDSNCQSGTSTCRDRAISVFSLKLKVAGPEIKVVGTSARQNTKLNEFLLFFNGKIL